MQAPFREAGQRIGGPSLKKLMLQLINWPARGKAEIQKCYDFCIPTLFIFNELKEDLYGTGTIRLVAIM